MTKREFAVKEIRTWILTGAYQPADPLPSTSHLCALLGVGKTVVADAMRELVERGYVRTVVGGARYVADRAYWPQLA